jgi:putative transposase
LGRVRFSRRRTNEAEQVLASLAFGSDEQIIAIVKEQEAGIATAEVCRRHGISGATFYKWKSKYGGLEVSEAKRLRSLEDENAKLKKLLAEAMLDIAVLKDISAKKW